MWPCLHVYLPAHSNGNIVCGHVSCLPAFLPEYVDGLIPYDDWWAKAAASSSTQFTGYLVFCLTTTVLNIRRKKPFFPNTHLCNMTQCMEALVGRACTNSFSVYLPKVLLGLLSTSVFNGSCSQSKLSRDNRMGHHDASMSLMTNYDKTICLLRQLLIL